MEAVPSYEKYVEFSRPTIEPHKLDLFTRVDLSIDVDELTYWKEAKVKRTWTGDDLMEIFENSNTDNALTLLSVDFSS